MPRGILSRDGSEGNAVFTSLERRAPDQLARTNSKPHPNGGHLMFGRTGIPWGVPILTLCLLVFTSILVAPVAADNPNAPADITIGTTIIAAHPERLGANIQVGDYQAFDPSATT